MERNSWAAGRGRKLTKRSTASPAWSKPFETSDPVKRLLKEQKLPERNVARGSVAYFAALNYVEQWRFLRATGTKDRLETEIKQEAEQVVRDILFPEGTYSPDNRKAFTLGIVLANQAIRAIEADTV